MPIVCASSDQIQGQRNWVSFATRKHSLKIRPITLMIFWWDLKIKQLLFQFKIQVHYFLYYLRNCCAVIPPMIVNFDI